MNSQQLWLPELGLFKTSPVNSQSWIGEGTIQSYSSQMNY